MRQAAALYGVPAPSPLTVLFGVSNVKLSSTEAIFGSTFCLCFSYSNLAFSSSSAAKTGLEGFKNVRTSVEATVGDGASRRGEVSERESVERSAAMVLGRSGSVSAVG